MGVYSPRPFLPSWLKLARRRSARGMLLLGLVGVGVPGVVVEGGPSGGDGSSGAVGGEDG